MIRNPKFGLHELVTLHWNDRNLPDRVVKRWFDPDDNSWWYELGGSYFPQVKTFPESALEKRSGVQ